MAGWITRVVTVKYEAGLHPRHVTRDTPRPPHLIEERRPTALDGADLRIATGIAGALAGPCGTAVRTGSTAGAWPHLLGSIADYVERWGHNPLDLKSRIGAGAKDGKRGRGSQDYLFQRKGAGDG